MPVDAPLAVEIIVLGGFRVTVDGVATAARGWSRRSAAALVKVLALAPGHRLHREQAMDLLWPDEPPQSTSPRLHKAAHFARLAAGHHEAVVLRDDGAQLFPGADITVDAGLFEQLARTAVRSGDPAAARDALTYYGGELLPGDRYQDWATDRRELLHLRHLDVLRVARQWREVAELDPTDEHAHVELMHRHLAAGDGAAAMRQYEHLRRVLARELGLEPGAAARLGSLRAELASLVSRQSAVLAELTELAAAGAAAVGH